MEELQEKYDTLVRKYSATLRPPRRGHPNPVSIHAPARGATAFDLVKNEKAQGKNIIALRPQSIYLEK